ncbi:MAG: FAD binding domain-containing protein [Thermodesulfobacteriota bacterium]
MHLPKFAHVRVSSLEEAARLIAQSDGDRCLAAGGTELLPRLKYGLIRPQKLISLKGVAAKAPEAAADGSLRLDALMTLSEAAVSPLVRERAPILAAAAGAVGSNEIRNMATLGGNLCQDSRCLYYNQPHEFQFTAPCFKRGGDCCYFIPEGKKCWAVFMADTAPALICLKAEVEIIGPAGRRIMPLEALYGNDSLRPLALASGEILSRVLIPPRSGRSAQAFTKFSWRRGFEFSAVSVAAVLEMEQNCLTCAKARIAAGSVAAAPLRAVNAETVLAGGRLSDKTITAAADQAAADIRPLPHHGYSRAYLTECLRVQVRRVLHAAIRSFMQT